MELYDWCSGSWLSLSPGKAFAFWCPLAQWLTAPLALPTYSLWLIPYAWAMEGLEPPLCLMEGKLGWILHSKWPFPLPTGVRAQTIHQWPSTKVQLKGSPLSLECTVKGTSNPNLYWYQQAEGGNLQMLFYSITINQVESQAPQNFEASRPQDGNFILHSKKLLLSDSGFYLCAWSITLSWVGQTSVQKPSPPLSPQPHSPGALTRGLGGGYLSLGFWWSANVRATESSQVPQKNITKFSGRRKQFTCAEPVNFIHTVTFPMWGCLACGCHAAVLRACYSPRQPLVCTGEWPGIHAGKRGSIHL